MGAGLEWAQERKKARQGAGPAESLHRASVGRAVEIRRADGGATAGFGAPPDNGPMGELATARPTGTYQPGVCNIGPAEIERRRRSALAATILTAVVAAAILVSGLPAMARLAVLPFAIATAITWLQVTRRFCVGFGAAGVLNFGDLGSTTSVLDPSARAADRRTVRRMLVEGLLYGSAATAVYWVLAGAIRPG